MQECDISGNDYVFNNEEVDTYNKLKEEIRKKKSQLTDFERKMLIDYLYKKCINGLIKNISNSSTYK